MRHFKGGLETIPDGDVERPRPEQHRFAKIKCIVAENQVCTGSLSGMRAKHTCGVHEGYIDSSVQYSVLFHLKLILLPMKCQLMI